MERDAECLPTLPRPIRICSLRSWRAVAGDRGALEDVCRAVQGSVYRLALRMLGAVEDAEDSTQEILWVILIVAFLVIWTFLDSGK